MTNSRIEIFQGDITTLDVDAIVNAANNSLQGGGGVDGAIHKAAGQQLLEECGNLNGCDTGDAKITMGYDLKAKYVIHAVGPVWYGGHRNEFELLSLAYRRSLEVARANKINSLAFPAISTGVYRFPKETAARIALNETLRFLKRNIFPNKVIFVLFDDDSYSIYNKIITSEDGRFVQEC